MGVTREEATVELGVSLGTIERNLGIGKSYFDRWGKQLKSDQEKYTEWWGTELKKREEMEVAAGVRAATRANLARKLRRDRAEANAERISEDIGQGSIPESWQKVGEAAKHAGNEAEGAFTHFKHHANHEIHGAAEILKSEFGGSTKEIGGMLKGFVAGYVTVIAFAAIEAWKEFTKFIADQVFSVDSPLDEITKGLLDHRREYYRKAREERDKQRAEDAREMAEARKRAADQEELNDQITDVTVRQNIEKAGPETDAGRSMQASLLNLNILNREIDLDRAKMTRDRLQISKAQLALEEANLERLKFQTDEKRRQMELNKIQNDAQRESAQIQRDELNQFMPTLQELSQRGIFGREARQIGRLERNIKRDFEFGNLGQAKSDLAARDKIYDSLAARGVLPEREAKRRLEEVQRRAAEQTIELTEGKRAIKVKPELK